MRTENAHIITGAHRTFSRFSKILRGGALSTGGAICQDLQYNSNFDFSESYITALNDSNQIKWELDKDKKYLKRKIISPGNYSVQLVDKEEIVSNVLNIVVKDYLDESSLSGKDTSFLTRISKESNGKYFEESNYLDGIKKINFNLLNKCVKIFICIILRL